ncbi:HlyD family efflux transporter periplasmic adaptor subunit [Thalassobaculum sp.]|uniref:efflux RND transporter periplasmic adaptor subunit n=1 Tax=Thalassobaculum sp. TaxID=2022740 RepID=UPI0032EDA260
MRRGTIGAAAATAAIFVMGVYVSVGSALDRSNLGNPSMPAAVAEPVAAVPTDAEPRTTQTPESNPLSLVESTGATALAAADTISATSWQLALGAYYLGGELLQTSGIVGTHIVTSLGIVPVQTEPTPASPQGPAAAQAASTAENARIGAWTGTGQANLTPSLDGPSKATAMAETGFSKPDAQLRVPASAGTKVATKTPETAVRLENASISAAAVQRQGESNVAGTETDVVCTWPALALKEARETESATLAKLTELGLMSEPAVRLPDGAVFLPKVAQRLLQIRTGYPCKGGVTSSRTLIGHVIADPTASGLVQASQDGRIEAVDWGLPRLGQRVTEGEVLGYLRPIWSNRDRASMEAEIATLRGEVAEKELELARSRELPLLPFRQGRILSIRLELDKLRRHRDALLEGLEGREPILASASGVVARADARVGQVVEAQHLLWEIVDEQRLWVEADWFGSEPPTQIKGATARRSSGASLALSYEGAGWTLTQQSAPLQFRIQQPVSGLRIGERVTVLVHEPVSAEGVLVPRSALVRGGNGETGLWAATSAERFETFRVRWKPVDGSVVAIEAGLPEGARVVVSGATLLSEVR